jgi:hypothetical protein
LEREKNGGVDALRRMSYVGNEALLSPEQMSEFDPHLR